MYPLNRRRFIATTGVVGSSLILAGTRASGQVLGANDRVRVAVAGLNGRGKSHIDGWLKQDNVEIAWAIDPDQTHPVRSMALGGRFQWQDQGETPNTMFAVAEYANGQQVLFNVRNVDYKGYQRQVENEYYFEDGGKIVSNQYIAAGTTEGVAIDVPNGNVTPGGNWGSFIAAVRAGDPQLANGNATEAHYACVLGHLMNNSYRLGEQLPFNAKAGRFGDQADVAEHFARLHAVMADGVGIPEDGNAYTVGPWLQFDPVTEQHTGEHAAAANALLKDSNRPGFEIPSVSEV